MSNLFFETSISFGLPPGTFAIDGISNPSAAFPGLHVPPQPRLTASRESLSSVIMALLLRLVKYLTVRNAV
ncbi:hypothetical protein HS088_TW01G00265 [Tripterygium wilfordii]|uniref:Uncharacterized protein n=1 Tax=Tripterygium wilfordii TaxID=458696 RepID=A0A7J7E197_TRIWF|nr:hypothetical protein HS088_TW01G00265 [Tripterygium wilfordii]